ncbi:MAG: PIN domain-containing protein [Actinobacteria bacterium]|nr:PIN domain-containing protein [Actinomycetota bacterium]
MIFVDTSFWVALRNRRDAYHEQASDLLRRHDRIQLVTTNHVRGETWTYLRRRAGHVSAVASLDSIASSPRVRVMAVSQEAEQRALAWLREHDEREYSFVDSTSFVLMRAMRMHEALAFDGDFSAAGFQELR